MSDNCKGVFIIDWILFWTAFGAIGGTIGALATAAAVIVALWQVKHSEKKKLKLSFSDSVQMIPKDPSRSDSLYIRLSIVNIGNRNLIIENWGFHYHNGNGHALLGFKQSPLLQALNPRLPHGLPIENSMDLLLEKEYFIRALREGVEKKTLNESQHIVFFVTDSTGKVYETKTDKTVREMLN